ncbi:MAG TPA: DUF3391 domain-containing protein [Candidatus Binatia bacterium]|nr:DUF3391 domain-containing protein [Candidatus Binatia bacterium]
MSIPEYQMKKRIPLSQLKPGMYVIELDRAWIHTPFLFNSKRINNAREIELLAQHGIREVVIDLHRGSDAELPTFHTGPQPAV